jgi:2-oxoisovalerate dehydrogenase E1 component beta subunit
MPYDAKGLLKEALRGQDPVMFFEHAFLYFKYTEEVPTEDYTVPIGKARIHRSGTDITLIAYSMMVHRALEAAKTLEADGISAEVVDLRTLSPLDTETICDSIRKTHRVVICSEDEKTGGVAAEVMATVMEHVFYELDAPIARIAAPDVPVPYSPVLEQAIIPKADDIVAAARKVVDA